MILKCNLCSKKIDNVLLEIKKPDRFEKFMKIPDDDYKRYWIKCRNCGVAVNILNKKSLKAIREIGTNYSGADNLKSVKNIQDRYQKIISLPHANSDNKHRVKRILNFSNIWYETAQLIDLLDIGAGTGVFLSELQKQSDQYSLKSTALETDPMMTKHLRSLSQFKVIEDLFPSQKMKNYYDFISLNKVLEHIENPKSLLEQISNHLNPHHGLFYLEVPCITNVWEKPSDDNSLGSIHFNLYSVFGLSKILYESGFYVLEIKRILEPSGKISVYAFACHKNLFRLN